MLVSVTATVIEVAPVAPGALKIVTEYGPALAYTELTGEVCAGDQVVLNRTANLLRLGTGGFDFVITVLGRQSSNVVEQPGHIIKARYTPSQLAVETLEEDSSLAPIWDCLLDGTPVVVCQLHSQIAHAAAAAVSQKQRVVYVMTDTAALPYSFSSLASQLKSANIIYSSITAGQAFGGEYETVTVHSALIAARHYLGADVIIVGQGPGNAGTGTRYGFGGIDQAGLLDIAAALGGLPIAVVRASSGDSRVRHNGVSHHTTTTLKLVRSSCTIPIPAGRIDMNIDNRHHIVEVSGLQEAFDLLEESQILVTTMGRNSSEDRIFFEASAAAGKFAASIGEPQLD